LKRPLAGMIGSSGFSIDFGKIGDIAIAMICGHSWQHLRGSGCHSSINPAIAPVKIVTDLRT
ncbi:hypothetical protein, partial [Rhizobium leguminosarum]|uniref:hypothetical protein n=1 Tax=Rhizobium leguminosarum TaxID=384 RepID=UPI001C90A7B2